jgi:hypothetical protein
MNNPFTLPFRETATRKSKISTIIGFGLFIFLFLFLFKPFGLTRLKPVQQLFITMGFGAITSVMLIVFKFLIEPVLHRERCTLGTNIIADLFIASSIGAANYCYIYIIFDTPFSFKFLLYSMWTAILVGSIPVTISYIMTYNKRYRDALKEADIPEEKVFWEEEVRLTAGNEKNDLAVNPKEVLFICSNDNYVTVTTIRNNTVCRTTIRGTLKSAESELKKNTRFLRCHKCYIVNLDYIDRVIGHSQNMKIKLHHTDELIPVSRSKANLFTGKE